MRRIQNINRDSRLWGFMPMTILNPERQWRMNSGISSGGSCRSQAMQITASPAA